MPTVADSFFSTFLQFAEWQHKSIRSLHMLPCIPVFALDGVGAP